MQDPPTRVDLWLDGYAAGLADGYTLARAEADHWYYVANNPAAADREARMTMTLADIVAARAEADEQRRQLDQEEARALDEARALIAAGRDDVEIAVTLGLFLPVVSRLREEAHR